MSLQIGDRMKSYYEKPYNFQLPFRMPVILRVDGKNFHTFTKDMERPFDNDFIHSMAGLTDYLCDNIQTAQFAYCQSDEISILLHPYKKLDSEPYFNNEVQKITSITAGFASAYFTHLYKKIAVFDTRCFVLPEDEVVNYFLWRQQDATRNSVSMVAQTLYSHKELHKKNSKVMQEMIFKKSGKNWNDLPIYKRRGFCVNRSHVGWEIDYSPPRFNLDRNYIKKHLKLEEGGENEISS